MAEPQSTADSSPSTALPAAFYRSEKERREQEEKM